MNTNTGYESVRELIEREEKLVLILVSSVVIALISANLSVIHSPLVGTIASFVFLFTNGAILGNAFFESEGSFLRWAFGSFLGITLLGLTSWAMLILYNIDALRTILVLCIVATLSYLVNRLARRRTTRKSRINASVSGNLVENFGFRRTTKRQHSSKVTHTTRVCYLILAFLSFYLLFVSRSGEVHTVWEVLHPMFMVTFFAANVVLLAIIFSDEKVEFKLAFVVVQSILVHIFFIVIFPAGDVGVQQVALGITRSISDNAFLHGYGGLAGNILLRIYNWFTGINFQAALSVVFARMFGVDVFWSHLLLVPILWGTFVPIILFMITRSLGGNERVSALSSLILSAFPITIVFGAMSVPNSLGYIFFLGSVYFWLEYLHTSGKISYLLAMTLAFASFISHFLTGILSLAFFILVIALKTYEKERSNSPVFAKFSLMISFIFATSLLPFALIYHRIFSPMYARFTLDILYQLSPTEAFWAFVLGDYFYYSPLNALVHIAGLLLGLVGMVYTLHARIKRSNRKHSVGGLCVILGFTMLLVDYRVLTLFMVGAPISGERLRLFGSFIAAPFAALLVARVANFLRKGTVYPLKVKKRLRFLKSTIIRAGVNLQRITVHIAIIIVLSAWITASVYYAYPHWGPLQTTSYELEAVKYIASTTNERYVVICDSWFRYAGMMFVGIRSPKAYYFSTADPRGVALFIEMKENPTNETMIKAMEQTDATIAYFIIQKPRLGEEKYDQIVSQAMQNGLQTYHTFDYQGQEKLRIFICKKVT